MIYLLTIGTQTNQGVIYDKFVTSIDDQVRALQSIQDTFYLDYSNIVSLSFESLYHVVALTDVEVKPDYNSTKPSV